MKRRVRRRKTLDEEGKRDMLCLVLDFELCLKNLPVLPLSEEPD